MGEFFSPVYKLANGIGEGFIVRIVGKRRLSCRTRFPGLIHGGGKLDSRGRYTA
jgi:hypothetical protein